LLAVALALVFLYTPVLWRLALQWYHDPDASHGFFVPLFAAYVLWERWPAVTARRREPSWWGVVLLGAGLAVMATGVVGAELFLARISLLIVIAGLIVMFLGWNYLRAAWFPLAVLLLMIPIPKILLNQVTMPLQRLAAVLATNILSLLGVVVNREGNIIHLPVMDLGVEEACSGIRSLMSLMTLALICGYFLDRRLWARVTLVAAAVPIAVFANSMRIVITGLLVQYWDAERALGFFHEFSGFVVFVVSVVLLLGIQSILKRVGRGGAVAEGKN
jgi:exosortase